MAELLEREGELGVLDGVVREASGGRGRVVLVGGEAGIGKSSLLRALRERVGTSAAFLVGACEPLSVPVPLGPWRELVEAADGGDLTALGTDDRLALARRVIEALKHCAPVVAAIEDVHWADPLTLDLLRVVGRRIEQLPAAIVVTFRDDEVAANPALRLLLGDLAGAAGVARLALGPLSASAVRRLAGGSGIDAVELARVTGGNPFLVVETVAAGHRAPASVRDAALARAGRLSADARGVVDAAAVIGQRFDHGLLEAVAPGSAPGVDEALARGVLFADGTRLGFRHELIREAIEGSISPPRRAELHARTVAALTARPGHTDHARLAHHAELAGLRSEASRYAALASGEAERIGALRETRLQAERALRLGDEMPAPERFELLIRYSRSANFSSLDYEDAVSGAEQALAVAERLEDPLRQTRALVALAWAQWSFDRRTEARVTSERAVAVLASTDDAAALARAESARIRMEATAFDPQAAIAAGPRALTAAAAAGLEEVRIDIAISVALARGHRGEPEAIPALEEALAAARHAGLSIQTVRTYVNLAYIGAMLRAHEVVDRTVAEGRSFCEEYDTPIPRDVLEGTLALSLLDRGRWDDALRALERGLGIWHAEVPVRRAVEGVIAARRGEPGAQAHLARAWSEIPHGDEDARHGLVRCILIETAWLRGDRAGALEHLRAAAASPATGRYARPGGELALWAWRHGIEMSAPARASEAVRLELEGDWRRAVRAWRELDAPYEAALAALPGDDRAAREALAGLHRLGARAAATAFSRERAALGARPARGPRRSTLANPAGLTRREQQVVEQLATGATNPEIAAALHLSERTVAHHVSAILGKLDAPNRRVAVDRARAAGLVAAER